MSEAAWGIVGTLSGTVLGWALAYFQDRRKRAFVGENVRSLLRLEIEQNLHELNGFLAAVDRRVANVAPVRHAQRADALRDVNLPRFYHDRWDSLGPLIAEHLKRNTILQIEQHHRTLRSLEENKATPAEDRSDPTWYPDQERFIARIREIGNPIR
jgi:hypothetical protein